MSSLSTQPGIVTRLEPGKIWIKIVANSACSTCHAKGACGQMDCAEKEIEVVTNEIYEVGERVNISINSKMGHFALFFAYLLPFFVLVGGIVLSSLLGLNDGASALIGLGAVVAYYLLLIPFRSQLSKRIHFQITRQRD